MALYFSPFGAVFLFSLLNILFYKMYALQKWPDAKIDLVQKCIWCKNAFLQRNARQLLRF